MPASIQNNDVNANAFTLKSLAIACLGLFGAWVLNLLDIFIVDKSIMNMAFAGNLLLTALSIGVCYLMGLAKPYTKYVAIAFVVVNFSFVCAMLSYHVMIAMALPLLYSVQYCDKKVVWYAYSLVAFSLLGVVFGGYHIGLCNANMLLFTAENTAHYYSQIVGGTLGLGDPGMPRNVALFLFFVLPQWLLLLAFVPVFLHISSEIESRARRAFAERRQAQIDFMTGLYNRNCYMSMLREHYCNVGKVFVAFWDVNGLKQINDAMGHEVGDRLIVVAAESFKILQNDSRRVFRVGGDEFVLIAEDTDEEEGKKLLEKWSENVKSQNEFSEIKLAVSTGYAYGSGAEIREVIKVADQMMYDNKRNNK